jgi:hypothetical protein
MAHELGIVPSNDRFGVNANGEKISAKSGYAYVELEKKRMLVEILIFDGAPLAGIGLFSQFGYKIVVDCKNRTAHLESTV